MQPTLPLDKILERLRQEQAPERPALRVHAPPPAPPGICDSDPVQPSEAPERGVAILDFTI